MARYRSIRTDFHTHPMTAGISPLARDLMLQAILHGGLLGCLERSLKNLAGMAGGGTTTEDVQRALAELEAPRGPKRQPLAVWWPDLEILWVVEAADEQARSVKAWAAVRNEYSTLPLAVRTRISQRYESISGKQQPESKTNASIGYPRIGYARDAPTDPVSDPDPDPDPDPEHDARARDRPPDPRPQPAVPAWLEPDARVGVAAQLLAEGLVYGVPERLGPPGPCPAPTPPKGLQRIVPHPGRLRDLLAGLLVEREQSPVAVAVSVLTTLERYARLCDEGRIENGRRWWQPSLLGPAGYGTALSRIDECTPESAKTPSGVTVEIDGVTLRSSEVAEYERGGEAGVRSLRRSKAEIRERAKQAAGVE